MHPPNKDGAEPGSSRAKSNTANPVLPQGLLMSTVNGRRNLRRPSVTGGGGAADREDVE